MEVFTVVKSFYNVFDRMKDNSDKNPHIMSRLEALQKLVVFVQQEKPDQLSEDVCKALEKLNTILSSANKLLERFNKINVVLHAVKAGEYQSEFESLNKSLTDAFVTLSGALHIDQEKKLEEQASELAKHRKKLDLQEKKLEEQEKKLNLQNTVLTEQDNKLHEQERKLITQERKLEEQEDKLHEQGDLLQRLEAGIESRGFYCVLL